MKDLERTFHTVGTVMDFVAARSRALSQNLASANVPGYQRQDVDFGELMRAMEIPDPGRRQVALKNLEPRVVVDTRTPAGPNGNNVAMEHELIQLWRMAILNEVAAQLASGRIQTLKLAIQGRSS